MAFTMEQGVKHTPIGCLASDHDSFKRSCVTGYSSLNKDARAQASECFVLSTDLEPSKKLVPSSPFSLGMSYEQVQETNDGSGAAGGASTPDVAPCTPCPTFLQQRSHGQKVTKIADTLPSLCLGIGLLERQRVPCIQRLRTPEKPTSSKEFLKQLSAGSPQSIFITPMQGHETQLEVQRETLEPFKEALFASKPSKPEQYWQESHEPHSLLSLGNLTETPVLEESPGNSRISRFSFLEALTAGDSQLAQETGFTIQNRSCLSEGVGCLQPSAECPNNFETILSKFSKQSNAKSASKKSLPWESSQQMNASVSVSNADNILVNSQACFSNAVCTVSSPPLVKQEWSTTFKRFPHLYQALSQVKNVPISACDERKSPEKRRRLLSAQENYASGASDTWRDMNGCSSNADRQSQNFEQLNFREALEAFSSRKTNDWDAQPPDNLFRPISLAKVKVENDYEDSYGGHYTHGDSVEENDVIGTCNAKLPPEMGFLGSSCAGTSAPSKGGLMDMAGNLQQPGSSNISVCAQLPQVLSTVSAGGPSVCLYDEQSRNRMHMEERTPPPMNRTSQIDGCWGKFLALSASGGAQQHMVKGHNTEIILPFQRRFKQLQEFLKQCDTSDKYSLQAFRSLSAAAMNGSAVELETRAVRLSLEEGRELKRMKRLNVLGKASEGVHVNSSGAVYGTRLPMPGNIVQERQHIITRLGAAGSRPSSLLALHQKKA